MSEAAVLYWGGPIYELLLFPHTRSVPQPLEHHKWAQRNHAWSSWQQLQGVLGWGGGSVMGRERELDTGQGFGTGQPSREPVSMGVMCPCQAACITLKMLWSSFSVQNWSHEHSPCPPGSNLLCYGERITLWALEVLALQSLCKPHLWFFLLISSWLWSGYRGKRDLIVKAAGGILFKVSLWKAGGRQQLMLKDILHQSLRPLLVLKTNAFVTCNWA